MKIITFIIIKATITKTQQTANQYLKMNRFFDLPKNVIALIYSFDNTYHSVYMKSVNTIEHALPCFSCSEHFKNEVLTPATYYYHFKTTSKRFLLHVFNNCLHENNPDVISTFNSIKKRRHLVCNNTALLVDTCMNMRFKKAHVMQLYDMDSKDDNECSKSEDKGKFSD